MTPARVAAKGRRALAELLIAQGADVNAKDKEGRTPLYRAIDGPDGDVVLRGDRQIVEMLIQAGADVNAGTPWGETPLHAAGCGAQQRATGYR